MEYKDIKIGDKAELKHVITSSDIDNFVYLRFNGANLDAAHWQFKFEPVIDPLAEFAAHPELVESGDRLYHYLENSGNSVARQLPVPYSQVYLA